MAEAVGITGTAVGTVAFGLQLYTGVSQYLDAVRGRDDDLAQAKKDAKKLQITLNAIQCAILGVEEGCMEAQEAVDECMSSCKVELRALETLLDGLQGPLALGTDPFARARGSLRKWGYPFRKGDIEKVEKRLNATNGVLQTALSALQLNISNLSHSNIVKLQRAAASGRVMTEENNEILKYTREDLRLVQRDISDMDRRLGEVFAYLHQAGNPMRQTAQLVSSPGDLRRMCDVVLASENQIAPRVNME